MDHALEVFLGDLLQGKAELARVLDTQLREAAGHKRAVDSDAGFLGNAVDDVLDLCLVALCDGLAKLVDVCCIAVGEQRAELTERGARELFCSVVDFLEVAVVVEGLAGNGLDHFLLDHAHDAGRARPQAQGQDDADGREDDGGDAQAAHNA